ncbi:MAG: J domain-containing protein [Pseudomonas sp.]|uniref:J domain-containing protein n=1 Tax=Pseudomonas sp. TaxID=306 RepID=UPI003395F43F
MSCWAILGLRSDADERAIKRSYAALLKVHRPDQDPQAFQRLRGAYEQALSLAHRRAETQAYEAELDGTVQATVPASELAAGDPPALLEAADAELAGMLAGLFDLTPAALDAVACRAKADDRLAMFERCLLERCLNDNEQGYLAAQWALQHLGWLTPWQESSLPSRQLELLDHRLLATELHGLHGLLVDGNEQHFVALVAQLHGQDWLQSFERRSYFNRQLVEILLAVEQWSPELLLTLCARCGWDEVAATQGDWLSEWEQLLQRGEQDELEQRVRERIDRPLADSGQARAAWLMFKPLSDARRRRLVDGFSEKDWQACDLLEQTLQAAPLALQRLAPDGPHDWRQWRLASEWPGAFFYLWLLLLLPCAVGAGDALDRSDASWLGAGFCAIALALGLATSLSGLYGLWRCLDPWLTEPDLAISSRLLPATWVRSGRGLLLLRHGLPAAALTVLTATAVWEATASVYYALACGLIGPMALAYAGVIPRPGHPLQLPATVLVVFSSGLERTYQRGKGAWCRVMTWKKMLVVGLILFVAGVLAALDPNFSQGVAGTCTWTLHYKDECRMPAQD